MSKRQRGFQSSGSSAGGSPGPAPTQPSPGSAGSGAGAPAGAGSGPEPRASAVTGSAVTGSRSAARRKAGSPGPAGLLERYRSLLLMGALAIGIGAVSVVFLASASAAPYTCATLMTPGPNQAPTAAAGADAPGASVGPQASGAPASPAPGTTPVPEPTPQLGFVAQDLGRGHVSQGASVNYAYCPPTSGQHYNIQGTAPLRRDFYGPDDELRPGNWLHNLEHGYVVLLYREDPGEQTLDDLRAVMDSAAPSELAVTCGLPNKVIAVRFDDMSTPYGAVAWDRAMLLDTYDAARLRTFAEQWQDGPVTPEPVC